MSKVKFSIFLPKPYHPLDFPILLFPQSSRKYNVSICVPFLSIALLSDTKSSAFFLSLFIQSFPLPSQFMLCHLCLLQWLLAGQSALSYFPHLIRLLNFAISIFYEHQFDSYYLLIQKDGKLTFVQCLGSLRSAFFWFLTNYQNNLVKEKLYSSEYLVNL